jgi:hypothetical protein
MPRKVLIVGSGLAGQTTAHLLRNDYDVTIFESGPSPSLDAASITLPSGARIDVPMRAFTDGYYTRLSKLYGYLGVSWRAQSFHFRFPGGFTHASNFSAFPRKPANKPWGEYFLLCLSLGLVYAYFTLCVFLRPPQAHEALKEWLHRIHLPSWFAEEFLLPLMSAVATCPHDALLQFPAEDVAGYKRRSHGRAHLVAEGGVGRVQRRLLEGVRVEIGRRVVKVDGGVVRWVQDGREWEDTWDVVVLAVAPDVVGAVFPRLKTAMEMVPTEYVEVVVHRPEPWESEAEDTIVLNTQDGRTEAKHYTEGVWVTTAPLGGVDEKAVIARTRFTRVLRSVESRQVVAGLFSEKGRTEKEWGNGDGGVFLVGGWCWDGMVLLEGCVRSAEVVAGRLGVTVPW